MISIISLHASERLEERGIMEWQAVTETLCTVIEAA
jgi:hypothetical protein